MMSGADIESEHILPMDSFPLQLSLHGLFEAQCQRTPDAIALVCGGDQLSYQQLNTMADRVAWQLVDYDLPGEALVGICLERSIEMVVMVLAVLKAGYAYVPIDPLYPAERIAFMLEDTQSPLVISNPAHRHLFGEAFCGHCVSTDELLSAPDQSGSPDRAVTGQHLAVIIYTSGSSGKPKGVMIEHEAYINRLYWRQHIHPLGVGDAVLQMTSFSFGPSVAEIFIPLMCGARCVLMSPMGGKHADEIVDTLVRENISATIMVPSLLATVLKSGRLAECRDTVKYVYCGGEALSPETISAFTTQMPHSGLHEVYGQTETVLTHHWDHTARNPERSYGHALPNKSIYVLDENRQPVAPGEVGEIYSAGVGVCRGYLNRPDLTDAKFIEDPFTDNALYRRMYATGDLARLGEDGEISLQGRADDQVKLRGFRVEIGEVESVAYSHPDIENAVANVVKHGDSQLLVLYYVPRESCTVIDDKLATFMAASLAPFMVPNRFVSLPALPRLPNGKIDRRSLPMPAKTRPPLSYDYVAPDDDLSKLLCRLWQQVLDIEGIGVNDNFFDLGGNSLAAVNLVQACRQQGLDVSFDRFYQQPTVKAMVQLCSHTNDDKSAAAMSCEQLDMTITDLAARLPIQFPVASSSQKQVLLTGATGLVGVHLLHYLLTQTDAEVVCVVRGDNEQDCLLRVKAALFSRSLSIEGCEQRLKVCRGDIAQPRLGLAQSEWDTLAECVDCIYHNGAWVNHVYPYALLESSNVGSTLTLI